LQFPQQKGKLGRVETSVGVIVASIRERELLNVEHFQGEIMVVPGLVDDGEDPVCFANLGQDQKQPPGFFQDPLHVRVIAQVTESNRLCEPFSVPGLQARGDKVGGHLLVDAFICPPYLLQGGMWGDQGMPRVAVDEGVEGDGLVIDHIGQRSSAHGVGRGRCPFWMTAADGRLEIRGVWGWAVVACQAGAGVGSLIIAGGVNGTQWRE